MRRFDQKGLAAGGLYLGIGAVAALASLQYPIGNFWRMGAGFFPLAVSLSLIAVGLIVALVAIAPAAPAVSLGHWSLRNLLLVTTGVVLFALLLRPAGIILALAALVAVAGQAAPDLRARGMLLSLAVLSLLTWVVFLRLLGLQLTMLPRGLAF